MKRYLYIIVLLCLVSGACQRDEFNIKGESASGPSRITLKLHSNDNILHTKAVSSSEEEKTLYNLSVFIFNSDGSKAYSGFYENLSSLETHTLPTIADIPAGSSKTIAVVANVDNTILDLTKEMLDGVSTKEQLLALTTGMSSNFLERGSEFLMSGIDESITLVANQNNNITINLNRVDAKIRFNVTTVEGVTFTPLDWRVISLPKKVSVFPNTTLNQFPYPVNYGTSNWLNFEEQQTPGTNTFAFYSMENKVSPKKNIHVASPATEETYYAEYALRERRLKTQNPNGTLTNGLFEYASDAATSIEMRGYVRYRSIDGLTETSADVVYTVHLGAVNGVNDYNTIRNTSYTYNVKIVSVDKIIIEVDADYDYEPRPGSEGDVVHAKLGIKEIDAYNNIFLLPFGKDDIDVTLTWNVDTPFSNGAESENPADYKWAYFGICAKAPNGLEYTGDFATYLGDNGIYTDEEFFNSPGYSHALDKFMADIALGTQKMLDVKQLVAVLKESEVRRIAAGGNATVGLYDTRDRINFTAFIREFYYETNPENPLETVQNGLWKKFVNQKRRVMNILSNKKYSLDQMSSKSNAVYSIRQSSIQTMYNRLSDENFTAWGSQMIQDADRIKFDEHKYITNTLPADNPYDDVYNGRKNSVNMWRSVNLIGNSWSIYMGLTNWTVLPVYNFAKYKCLGLNRDMNGNGLIDEKEVQWYLASINQLTDIWIGEYSYDSQSKLYKLPDWVEDRQWYVSSTVTRRYGNSQVLYRDNPRVLWSAESSSESYLSYIGLDRSVYYYRCVRNLGLPADASIDVVPDDFATYDTGVNIMKLSKLDERSMRGFSMVMELPDHTERDPRGYNKPWYAFEIASSTTGTSYTWEQVRQRSQPGGTTPVCPAGWRVPNQRELALMFSRIRTASFWPLSNHFSRTGFTWGGSARPGFAVSKDAGVFYLINNVNAETGGVRCVRDVIR